MKDIPCDDDDDDEAITSNTQQHQQIESGGCEGGGENEEKQNLIQSDVKKYGDWSCFFFLLNVVSRPRTVTLDNIFHILFQPFSIISQQSFNLIFFIYQKEFINISISSQYTNHHLDKIT